jgi:pSer/pThr/pTyr-binding forkhead associated (FHA) protein
MLRVTLRVLDGADRGRVFANLEPPITLGREEGNIIQLNDERVSRYHAKIQLDHDHLVLTDLQSTNGTRVNGEDIQLRNLRFGDVIHVGRTVLVFGSREQIDQRLKDLNKKLSGGEAAEKRRSRNMIPGGLPAGDSDIPWKDKDEIQEMLFSVEPPELPDGLSPAQAAQTAEVIEYLLINLRHLIRSVEEDSRGERVTLDAHQWQNLVDLQCRLAEYLRKIGDPDSGIV